MCVCSRACMHASICTSMRVCVCVCACTRVCMHASTCKCTPASETRAACVCRCCLSIHSRNALRFRYVRNKKRTPAQQRTTSTNRIPRTPTINVEARLGVCGGCEINVRFCKARTLSHTSTSNVVCCVCVWGGWWYRSHKELLVKRMCFSHMPPIPNVLAQLVTGSLSFDRNQ